MSTTLTFQFLDKFGEEELNQEGLWVVPRALQVRLYSLAKLAADRQHPYRAAKRPASPTSAVPS
jgi:hypothetical protein